MGMVRDARFSTLKAKTPYTSPVQMIFSQI
jgi:hypothetical protein